MPDDLREFVTKCYRDILCREPDVTGLELVDCFWHKKFNTPRNTFWKYKHTKDFGTILYYKNILKELLKPQAYPFYFIWSRKTK